MEEQKHTIALTDLDKVELYKLLESNSYGSMFDPILEWSNNMSLCHKQWLLCILRSKSFNEYIDNFLKLKSIIHITTRVSCGYVQNPNYHYVRYLQGHLPISVTLHSSIGISHIVFNKEKIVNTNKDLRTMHHEFNHRKYYEYPNIHIHFSQSASNNKHSCIIIKERYCDNDAQQRILQLLHQSKYYDSNHLRVAKENKDRTNNNPIYKEKISNTRKMYDCASSIYLYNGNNIPSYVIYTTEIRQANLSDYAEYTSANLVTLLEIMRMVEVAADRHTYNNVVSLDLRNLIQRILNEPIKNIQNREYHDTIYKLLCACYDAAYNHEKKQLETFMKRLTDQAAIDECTKWLHDLRDKVIVPITSLYL